MSGEYAANWESALRNGYEPIPIARGQKGCFVKGWPTVELTPARCQEWAANGHAKDGLGIRTGHVVGVDCDTFDEDILRQLAKRIIARLGKAPVRIGNPPKRLLLYRTARPFRKMVSREYLDSEGRKAQVEILGERGQFVADAVHPDTRKPYRWPGDSYLTVPADQLRVIKQDDCRWIIDQFHELADAAGWQVKAESSAPPSNSDDELHDAVAEEPLGLTIEQLTAKVMLIPNDDVPYGDDGGPELGWFKMLAAIHHETGGSEEGRALACDWSSQSLMKHEDGEFDKAWNSLGKPRSSRPRTARYILRHAKPYETKAEKTARGGLTYLDADEATPDLGNAYLIKGVIDRGSLAMVYGDSAAGKTFVMLHAAYCVAAGAQFFDRRTAGGVVLYLAAEAGHRIRNRVAAARAKYPRDKSIPVRVVTSRINLFADEVDLERITDLVRETEAEFGQSVVWIIIDTFARANPGMDENSGKDMGQAIDRMDKLRVETNAAISFVHHSGKDASRGGRGHSSSHAAVDHELVVKREGKVRYLELGSKQRDGKDGDAATFELEIVELGEDQDGDPVTTCVVKELNPDAPPPATKEERKAQQLPRSQQAAFDALQRLHDSTGEDVTYDQLVTACSAPECVSASKIKESRERAARRAISDLIDQKLLHRNGNLVSRYPEFDLE
jgi:hypothetical protein